MSDKSVNEIFNETKSKLNGYAMLFYFHLANICIKADPLALLSTTVEIDGAELNLEDVADAGLADDYTFYITPRAAEYVFPVCKAVKMAHPEFKVEEKVERNELSDEEETVIYYTMPIVNEDRRDVCNDFIKTEYDVIAAKMDVAFTAGSAKIVAAMAGAEAEALDRVKEKLQEVYDQHKQMCDKFRDEKIQEVEEAYRKYLSEQTEKSKQAEEKQAAEGGQNIFSMNMNDEDE